MSPLHGHGNEVTAWTPVPKKRSLAQCVLLLEFVSSSFPAGMSYGIFKSNFKGKKKRILSNDNERSKKNLEFNQKNGNFRPFFDKT